MPTDVCPKCSYPTSGAKFCSHCGARLTAPQDPVQNPAPHPVAALPEIPGQAAAGTEGAAAPLPAVPEIHALPQIQGLPPGAALAPLPALPRNPALSRLPEHPRLPELPPLPSPFRQPPSGTFAAGEARGGRPVLECSLPERFVEGLAGAVAFRLCRPWRGVVETTVSIADGCKAVAGPAVRRGPIPEEGAVISLNVRPPEAGALSVEVRVENRFDGANEAEVWTAPLVLPVQPRENGASSFTINIENKGDLADISLGSLAGGLPKTESAAERLLAGANRRVFRPMDGCTLVSAPTRLTLRTPAGLLHLVSRTPAWFGRQGEKPAKGRVRDNAIVLRPAAGASSEDACAALCVSRTHFMVERDGARCRIRDGAPARDEKGNILPGGAVSASSGGLAVGNEILESCGAASVPAGESRTVRLSPSVREGGAFALDLLSLPSAETPAVSAGALLRRTDGAREAYMALWGEVDLGRFAPELGGHSVRWDGTRFVARASGSPETPLAAGDSFGPAGWRVCATAFSQL